MKEFNIEFEIAKYDNINLDKTYDKIIITGSKKRILKEHDFPLLEKLLSKKTKEKSERVILWIAIVSFILHLVLIGLIHVNIIAIDEPSNLLKNPIAAIYTPFSFILVYEVYLLIYYLPKSTSTYISKQYEIIALIIIRRLFKDLSDLSLSSNWFNTKNDLQFTYDLVASVFLFYLIYLFHVQRTRVYRTIKTSKNQSYSISKFIKAKKLARPITLSEFEVDPDEWNKISTEGSMVRFLEGGKKLIGKEENFFDKDYVFLGWKFKS